jgi:hypothetical protein
MIDSGEAELHLSPSEFRLAQKLLAAHPLDADALCSSVGLVTNRGLTERFEAVGIFWPGAAKDGMRDVLKNPIPFTRSAATVEPISFTS